MKLTLNQIKKNKKIQGFIRQSEQYMDALGYTDHGLRHVSIVSDRARSLAKKMGLSDRDQELAAIAGYCHDMGNFLGRTQHHYWSTILFSQVFMPKVSNSDEISTIMQAIVSHDKNELKLVNAVSAVLILADKSDVHRTRVKEKDLDKIKLDIHDRVNYAVTDSSLIVDEAKKDITLKLILDTAVTDPMEYFEIFNDRMSYCRKAAEYLKCDFGLMINDFKLS